MYEVTLNEAEQRLTEYIAKKRIAFHQHDESVIQKKREHWERDQVEIDREGFGGEIAYCKFMNLYPDLESDLSSPDYDCMSCNGEKIDVKTTKYREGHLIVPVNKITHPADKYVLVTGEFPVYNIVGQCGADQLFMEENIRDFGKGPGYTLGQNKLEDVL